MLLVFTDRLDKVLQVHVRDQQIMSAYTKPNPLVSGTTFVHG